MIKKLSWFGILYTIFLIVGGIILITTNKRDFFYLMNGYYSSISDELFAWITWLGHGSVFIIAIIITGFKKYSNIMLGLFCFLLSSGLAQFLKKVVFSGTLRPSKYFENDAGLHFVEGVKLHSYHSFPSGHAASAFSLAVFLTLISRNARWGLLWGLLALITAYSRVYLSQHFFEDIYVGSMVGVFSSVIIFILFERKLSSSEKWSKGLIK